MSFRLACRTLRRSPWYAATVIGTIALSISLAATVFAVVDGVLFNPLPYVAPERLYQLVGSAGPGEGTASLSPTDVRYLNETDPRVSVTGFGRPTALTHPDRPDLTIWSATIDARFFDVLGQYPLVGGFSADHFNQPAPKGEARPAIVSHGFWRQWLAADASVLGRRVDMVGAPLTIVGVLPRDFVFPTNIGRIRPDVLFPSTAPPPSLDRWNRSLNAVARLDETVTADEAKSTLSAMLATRVNEYPAGRRIHPGPYVSVVMQPLEIYLGNRERPLFRLAFSGAALLMVLGAINVAGLLAARGRERARELTVRVALGAGRLELARLMMSEALLVALLGSVVGLALAQPLLAMTLQLLPESLLLLKAPAIDWRVVVFAMLTASVVVGAFALGPAAALARSALSQRLSGGITTTPRVRSWSGSALLAAECAIGIALVLAGSLVLASFIVLRGEDAGFDTTGLAVLDIRTPGATTADEVKARHGRVLEGMRLSPGVSGVARIGVPLLENMFGGSQFAPPPGAGQSSVNDVSVSSAFFGVAGLQVLDGRVLTDLEIDAGRPVAVVSELTARRYWPAGRAVGQTLASTDQPVTVTVVGVVEEARFGSHEENWHGEIYVPERLLGTLANVYLLRTAGDPDVVVRDTALALQNDVPGLLVRRAESFDDALLKSVRIHSFRSVVFGVSAAASLLLLAVGIGGLVTTAVVRRAREIGVRSALGARRHQLVSMVIIDHLRPSLVGLGVGLLASWWTTRLLSAFLYQVDAHDPMVWLAASLSLIAVAVVAAWIPARRASTVDAMTVLKAE